MFSHTVKEEPLNSSMILDKNDQNLHTQHHGNFKKSSNNLPPNRGTYSRRPHMIPCLQYLRVRHLPGSLLFPKMLLIPLHLS